MAAARSAGLPDLKIPEPTKTPSAPSCIIIAASAGVARSPAVDARDRSLRPPPRRPAASAQLARRPPLLPRPVEPGLVQCAPLANPGADPPHVPGRLDHVARPRLALAAD